MNRADGPGIFEPFFTLRSTSWVTSKLRGGIRIAAALACFVWVSSASAGPAVIIASRIEVFDAPSNTANVVSFLGRGSLICVLDNANYSGVLYRRLGWLAIRLPGGVGYVSAEAVDLAAPATAVRDCRASANAPQVQDPESVPDSRAGRMAVVQSSSIAHESEPSGPAAAVARPALITGGFLPLRPARILMSLGSGMAWLSKESAAKHQIDDSSATINGTLGLTMYDVFMVSGSFSVAFPTDYSSFSQDVVLEMGGGDPHSASSSLSVASYSIAAGLRTPFWALGSTQNGRVAGALFAEYGSAGIAGTRSIADCVDCRVDKLDMPGGTFWHVGFDLLVPSHSPHASYGLTVAYQRYEEGAGFTDEFRVGISGWLQ